MGIALSDALKKIEQTDDKMGLKDNYIKLWLELIVFEQYEIKFTKEEIGFFEAIYIKNIGDSDIRIDSKKVVESAHEQILASLHKIKKYKERIEIFKNISLVKTEDYKYIVDKLKI